MTASPDPSADQLRMLWRIAGMAIMMSAEVAAGALIGWLIDRWAGTAPRWLTIGGVVGIVVGMTSFLTAAFKYSRQMGGSRQPIHDHEHDRHDG